MRIGLYDINKSSYGKMRYEFPEIDLMKVYSYYKKNKNNVIELCEDYKKYKDYDLFYCFNNRRHVVSKDLLKLQNDNHVFLIGTCFYGDIWIPMDEEIEKCEPDITSYSSFLRTNIINDTLAPWTANLFSDYYYLRYYYPDWHWDLSPNKIKDKKVILYDFDLTSNDKWQDLCLQIKQISGKKFVCRHNIIMRDTDTLKFIIDNEIYKSSTKYPTKFIIDIPEALHNFKEYFDEYKEYFNAFPVNSLFLFQNHPFPHESEISCFARLIDDCMYALNSNIEIYPIYDYSLPQKEYDNFIKRVTYYFTMRKSGSIHEIIREKRAGGDPTKFYTELKIQYPEFNKQIIEVTRAEVKKKEKIWSYGIR